MPYRRWPSLSCRPTAPGFSPVLCSISPGPAHGILEIIFRRLCLQVLRSPLHADTRKGRGYHHLLPFPCGKIETRHVGCPHLVVVVQDRRSIQLYLLKRYRETSLEKHFLVAGPPVGKTVAPDGHRIHHLHITVLRGVPVHRFLQVQDNGRLSFRKRVTLDAATLRGCQLHLDSVIFQKNLIITRRRTFLLVRELGMYAQRRRRLYVGQGDRHKRNVIQIACAGTRKVCMTESGNGAVRIIIPRNPVPARQTVVRTQLYHTERYLCSRIRIPCKIGSDKRIYILCQIFPRRNSRRCTPPRQTD